MRTTFAKCLGGLALIGSLFFWSQCVKEDPASGKKAPPASPPLLEQPRPDQTAKVPPPGMRRAESPKNGLLKSTLPPSRTKDQDGGITLSPQASPAPSAAPPRVQQNETGLFVYFPQQRLMPEDFKIGALQDGITASRDSVRAAETVRKFFDSIARKEVDYSLVLPSAKAAVQAVIAYPLTQGYVPERCRVGKMAFENDDELRANVRLYKGEGVTAGEVYLKKSDEQWLVSDLQAGFTLLGRKYVKPAEPFVPGSYKFLLDDH